MEINQTNKIEELELPDDEDDSTPSNMTEGDTAEGDMAERSTPTTATNVNQEGNY